MQTKADRIRSALKAYPNIKATEIAKALGIDPQEIYMVRYADKKRARLKARKARARKADFDAFNDIANKIPTFNQVTKSTKQTLEQAKAADYLVALNRASTNAERAVKETEKLRETLAANSMHPVATIAISVVASVLIVVILGGIL